MNQKDVLNIVRFSVTDEIGNSKTDWDQAFIFYADGSVKLVSVDEALDISENSKVAIRETTSEEVTNNFQKFRKIPNYVSDEEANSFFEHYDEWVANRDKPFNQENEGTEVIETISDNNSSQENKKKDKKTRFSKWKAKRQEKKAKKMARKNEKKVYSNESGIGRFVKILTSPFTDFKNHLAASKIYLNDKKAEKKAIKAEKAKKDEKNSEKNTKSRRSLSKRVGACFTALMMAIGFTACTPKKNENQDITTSTLNTTVVPGSVADDFLTTVHASDISNDNLSTLSFEQLLEKTKSEVQKKEMSKVGSYLDYFNGTFADKYVEATHPNIRATLTWGEVNALNLAYNDFTKEEIRAIFNGYEVNSYDFTAYYKEATLQLMGAFVLETREQPVSLDSLLNTEEGKAFYQKYNELFLKCKEANGDAKVAAVNALYQEAYKDFPITEEVREVGISHLESRDDIESYKLAVTPIFAASEMMFQNLAIDHTFSDKVINYFNDLGLCEYAQGKYDRAEQITLAAYEDEANPTFQQFMDAKITELKNKNIYFVSDANRDLSQLDLFQKNVNGSFDLNASATVSANTDTQFQSTQKVSYQNQSSSTSYRTETSKVVTTDRNQAVSLAGEEAVKNAEDAVNQQIEKENQVSKEQGLAQAEQNRQDMQAEADKHAEEIRDEIEQDKQDFQDNLDQINNQINQNNSNQDSSDDQKVNIEDFGHGTQLNPGVTDEADNVDDSYKDFTTDGSGADVGLPDPNETGKEFDSQQPDYNNQPSSTVGVTVEEPSVGTTSNGDVFVEYEEKTAETPVQSNVVTEKVTPTPQPTTETATNEEIANAIVEEMANNTSTEEENAFVYTKK